MKKFFLMLINSYHSSIFYKYRLIKRWNKKSNPHKIKEMAIIKYCDKYNYKTFVETGTYLGEMVYALKYKFDILYTIELSLDLFKTAKKHFIEYKNIYFFHGDSGVVLEQLMNKISEPAIFWLDGHYSGGITEKGDSETPILKELQYIFSSQYPHVILIDDARCFGNPKFPDYPSIQELKNYVTSLHPSVKLSIM
jgi:hypothetical protein